MTHNPSALVVDDNDLVRDWVAQLLMHRGYSVQTARDGQEGVDSFRTQNVDLIMLDLAMPRMGGLEALQRLRAMNSQVFIVVMSGSHDAASRRAAEHLGAAVLEKPFDGEALDRLLAESTRTL